MGPDWHNIHMFLIIEEINKVMFVSILSMTGHLEAGQMERLL